MPLYGFRTGTQHQVKCVAKQYLGAGLGHLRRIQCLYRAVGANRHERRRCHFPPGKVHDPGTGAAIAGTELKLHMTGGHGISINALEWRGSLFRASALA